MDESEETWDLMIFGDRGVGKSSFRLKFEINPRIEGPVDRRVVIKGVPCVLWLDESLWTSHYALMSERCLGDITEMIWRYHYFILIFIKEVREKHPGLNHKSDSPPPRRASAKKLRFLLIGMKSDLTDRRQVTRSEAESLANMLEGCLGCVETSAKQDASQSIHEFIQALRAEVNVGSLGSMQRPAVSNNWLKKVFSRKT